MNCHYGLPLPHDGSPCKLCGAEARGGMCGKVWEAGYKTGYEEAVSRLLQSPDRGVRGMGEILSETRPLEASGPTDEEKRIARYGR